MATKITFKDTKICFRDLNFNTYFYFQDSLHLKIGNSENDLNTLVFDNNYDHAVKLNASDKVTEVEAEVIIHAT